MFTRLSQFTYGDLHIPNIDTVQDSNDTNLLIHIQKYEKEGLILAIGQCLYDDLMSNLEKDENGFYIVKEGSDEKWDWLLNGHTYDSNSSGCGCSSGSCNKHHWKGLITEVAEILNKKVIECVLAPYVYFNWNMNYRTLSTGIGEGKGVSQNTVLVPSRDKRVDSWNRYIADMQELYKFLSAHKTEFPNAVQLCFKPITYWDI